MRSVDQSWANAIGVLVTGILCLAMFGPTALNIGGRLDRATNREWALLGRRRTLLIRGEHVARAKIRTITAIGLAVGIIAILSEVAAIVTGRVG